MKREARKNAATRAPASAASIFDALFLAAFASSRLIFSSALREEAGAAFSLSTGVDDDHLSSPVTRFSIPKNPRLRSELIPQSTGTL